MSSFARKLGVVTLASITHKPGTHTVYNLEVETEHSYYVTESAVLTHNDRVNHCAPLVDSEIWSDAIREGTITAFKGRLPEVIESFGVPKKEIAERLGISHTTIYDHLRTNYRTLPRTDFLLVLARTRGVSIDWLLGVGRHASSINRPTAQTRRLLWYEPIYGKPPVMPIVRARLDAEREFKIRFTALAIRANMSDRVFAESLGRRRGMVQTHVSGGHDHLPSIETLIVLARKEDVRIDWLLGLSNRGAPGVSRAVMAEARRVVAQEGRHPPRVLGSGRGSEQARERRIQIATGFQRRMAKVMGGMSQAAYTRKIGLSNMGLLLKKEDRLPSASTLIAIALADNVSADWLLGLRSKQALHMTPASIARMDSAIDVHNTIKHRLALVTSNSSDSRADFARTLGVNPTTLDRYLSPTDSMLPAAEMLVSIAQAGDVRIDWLLGLID